MAASLAAADPVRAVGLAGPAEDPQEASATAEQLAALLAAMAVQDEPPPPDVAMSPPSVRASGRRSHPRLPPSVDEESRWTNE